MVQKAPIRNEHHEAYRAGRLDEIPAEVLPLLEANYAKLPKAEGAKKAAKAVEVSIDKEAEG